MVKRVADRCSSETKSIRIKLEVVGVSLNESDSLLDIRHYVDQIESRGAAVNDGKDGVVTGQKGEKSCLLICFPRGVSAPVDDPERPFSVGFVWLKHIYGKSHAVFVAVDNVLFSGFSLHAEERSCQETVCHGIIRVGFSISLV